MTDKDFNDSQGEGIIMAEEKKEAKLSLFQRILKVFTNPVEVMDDISVRPTVLVPMLLALVIFTLLNIARFDLMKEATIKQLEIQMAQNPNAAQLPDSTIMGYAYFGLIMASISPLFVIFFKGLISYGITQLFDGKGKLKASISIIAFSYFIVALGELIRTIIGLLTKNYMVTTSLAVVFPNQEMGTPLYTLLASFDVFSIWYLIVSLIGFSVVHKVSKGKAAAAVFLPWILSVGFYVVMAILRG